MLRIFQETGYDIWSRFYQVRGAQDKVRLEVGDSSGKLGEVERDSFSLRLIAKDNKFNFGMHAKEPEDSLEMNQGCMGVTETTSKWNPLTYAVLQCNLPLVTLMLQRVKGNS